MPARLLTFWIGIFQNTYVYAYRDNRISNIEAHKDLFRVKDKDP